MAWRSSVGPGAAAPHQKTKAQIDSQTNQPNHAYDFDTLGGGGFRVRMAAEGAVAAYEQVIGETWKPFDRPVENPGASLDRKAAEAQLAAFG